MTVVGFVASSRELLDRPAEIPKRVLEEIEKAKKVREERGESIDDIFAQRIGAAASDSATAENSFENPPVN